MIPGADIPIVPVVGIGASAGGLEAFTQLLNHLPLDTGLAFVLIQHLDPNHESMLTGILSRETRMPVEEVQDGASVEPNRVYVIPPNTSMTISGRVLRLKPREQVSGPHMPIDHFLRSLAESCQNKAIGVILSGTGSDGALGLEAIKAEGGIVFAQDAESAKFDSMPLRAQATGCVDFVLPPDQIAGELARIGQHPYVMHPEAAASVEAPEPSDDLQRIFALLRTAKGVDFSLYKQTTIDRRIRRRLALQKVATLADYVRYLQDTPAELNALYNEILIKVTSFFRDAPAFDALKEKVIPHLLENRSPNLPIRVWVPGCATGEEAYSIGMCLLESAAGAGASAPIQIFASDISEPAIEKARAGLYLENVAADISPERLERFFIRTDGGYQVGKPLRELCIFTRQDLINDPPFSKLDLIGCRNVLIYMGPVQKRIIPILHYALKPQGYLMLGVSETARGFPELFQTVDKKNKIYCRKEVSRKLHFDYTAGGFLPGVRPAAKKTALTDQGLWNSRELQQKVDVVLLARFSSAGVVVDEDMEVLEVRGHVGPYLEFSPGKASFSLSKLACNAGLAVEIRAAIQEAKEKTEPVRKEPVQIERDGEFRDIGLEVVPLEITGRRTFLVLFEELAQPPAPAPERQDPEERANRQILRLKQELAATRKHMLDLIEDQETSRDESQSVAEETLSTNEELQSINEELETAKEELQATNEEMASVNDELQNRNVDLQQSRDFALSIVNTIRDPLLVLGMDCRVISGNRSFYAMFHTAPAETEGRSLFELGAGHFDKTELRTRLEKVLRYEEPLEDFEIDGGFANIGPKVFLLSANRLTALQMLLLTFEDITARRAMENALRTSEEQLRQVQKMEAVGRLAGGIAHDFNNLLTVVLGHSDMLLGGPAEPAFDREALDAIRHAAERGASLTQQLLAFSRRQVLQPKLLDVGDLVAEFERMLRRLVGEHIDLVVNSSPALWRVLADPGQLGRVIMNLALNARDAMPQGGTLTMDLSNVHLDEAAAAELKLPSGPYVMIAVGDTGIGMDAETQAPLFEPFFTTKGRGVGTGLGLPVVFGIVEQSGGAIRVRSEVGRGTAFRIYLPRVEDPSKSQAGGPGELLSEAPRGTEVVLLVEDEDGVRKLARAMLEMFGYTVIEARHGKEGLSVCESHEGRIDILVTDVLMPGIGGRELAERAALLRPEMAVLFMSGHTDDAVLDLGIKLRGTPFLQKPFTVAQLARKVRAVLDARGEGSRPR